MNFFFKSFNPITDLPDLSGKVVLITGGNTGIGYSTVKHLARLGAKVYMGARSQSKAEAAIAKLKAEGLGPGNGEVVWLDIDLKDPRNSKKAAEEFMKKEKRLDVLILNAAVFMDSYAITPDGVQDIIMVNVISHIVLTRSLQPLLDKTAAEPNSDVRIVVVTSEGHGFVPGTPRFRNLDDLNAEYKDATVPAFTRYCFTKLANTLYARELQRRLTAVGSRITVMPIHPGAVYTSYFNNPSTPYYQHIFKPIVYLFFSHQDKGAYTSVFAAASEEVAKDRERYRGAYLTPVGKVSKLPAVAADEALAKELMDSVETFLQERGI